MSLPEAASNAGAASVGRGAAAGQSKCTSNSHELQRNRAEAKTTSKDEAGEELAIHALVVVVTEDGGVGISSSSAQKAREVKSPGISCVRFIRTKTSARAQTQTQQSRDVTVTLPSPGFVHDPYIPSEPMPLWCRLLTALTISGLKRTRDIIVSKVKSNYAYAKVRRKYGEELGEEITQLYQEISTVIANGDIRSLRKFVTDNMYSVIQNEIKEREKVVARCQWELILPMVNIRHLQARLIWTDNTDPMKSFAQITVDFLSEQKFVAYDFKGDVVAGDKDKVVLVREIWVVERSLFHDGAYWRLCGRIML